MTDDELFVQNDFNLEGDPAGGTVTGKGLSVRWQNGPLGRGDERREPNGAFVETVLEAAASRIQFYQSSKFACRENSIALTHIETALLWLNKRTAERERRGVEGLNDV